LSGWALYNDGQMINSNVIIHITKECLGSITLQQRMAGAGEFICVDSPITSDVDDVDSALILKEEQ